MNNNPLSHILRTIQSDKRFITTINEHSSEHAFVTKERHIVLSMIALLSLVIFAFQVNANKALIDLPPGHWYRFPSSTMYQKTPLNDINVKWRSRSINIMNDWGGGAYDTDRNRLIVWGGGHSGYPGNEAYVFDLNLGMWKRLGKPSPLKPTCKPDAEGDDGSGVGCSRNVETMPDGRPVSRHTYDTLEYLPNQKVLWSQGGSRWRVGDCSNTTWTLDININLNFDSNNFKPKWTEKKNGIPGDCTDTFTIFSAYDEEKDRVFSYSYGFSELYMYNPKSPDGSWTSVSRADPEVNFVSDKLTAAIDLDKRKMIVLGNLTEFEMDKDEKKDMVLSYDLSDIQNVSVALVPTKGATEITKCNGPGFDYDTKSKQLVAWCGDFPGKGLKSEDIYVLNIIDDNTMKWTKETLVTSSINAPGLQSGNKGTYGRFRYVPDYDVFVLATGTRRDVYAFKRSTVDVDGNLNSDALTDGLLIIRYLFGIRGDTLTANAVASDCERCTIGEIKDYLEKFMASTRPDVDGNGEIDALTDGLLIIRYLFGIRGDTLIEGSVADDCTRCSADEVETYITSIL